jgi:hypothetical protein
MFLSTGVRLSAQESGTLARNMPTLTTGIPGGTRGTAAAYIPILNACQENSYYLSIRKFLREREDSV